MGGRRYACTVVPITFQPYVETEEFACIGVLIYCPEVQHYSYRLVRSGDVPFRRVCQFFREIDVKICRDALKSARFEIENMIHLATEVLDPEVRACAFRNLIKPRESFIRYGNPRCVLTSDLEGELGNQYAVIVQRSFVDREGYYESEMRARVSDYLNTAKVHFQKKSYEFEKGLYKFTLPFLIGNGAEARVIKPLNFIMKNSNETMDHWFKWQKRFDYLKNMGMTRDRILVPFRMPLEDSAVFAAADFARESLMKYAQTVNESDLATEKKEVLAFVS